MYIIQEAIIFGFTQSFVIGPLTLLSFREGLKPKRGLWYQTQVVLAGTIVDLMYLMLALHGVAHFVYDPKIQALMWTGATVLLVVSGTHSLLEKNKKTVHHHLHKHHIHLATTSFSKGFIIGLLNPMAIVFWVMVAGSMYTSYNNIVSPDLFALNIVFGGVIGTMIIVALTQTFKKFFHQATLKKIVSFGSILLIGYGIWFGIKAFGEWQTVMAAVIS